MNAKILLTVLLSLLGFAVSAESDIPEEQTCVPLQRIESLKILDDQTILFSMTNGPNYLNKLPNKCIGMRPGKTLMYKTSLSQLCHLDTVTVLDNVGGGLMRGASCGLGKFSTVMSLEGDR